MAALLAAGGVAAAQSTAPHVTWHWHQHQPIYWNDRLRLSGPDRYEYAWESIQMKDGGNPHPMDNLRDIFGKDDRVAAYQWRMRDSIASIGHHTNSGVSISFSGALKENINSLGQANQLGYSPSWSNPTAQAMGWTTTGGKPRLDNVNFTFHHSLTGLHNRETLYMEIRLHQEKMKEVYGQNSVSRGFFPTELTFSTRLIPMLRELGIEWTYVSGEHIARACPDFPLQLGSGGVNCAPPNRADQKNPPGEVFIRQSISRGCAPVNANPLSYQPAWARYIDPDTGTEHRIIVVPVDQAESWNDGYQCIGAGFIDALKQRNNPAQPSLVVLCHDGDNAFGGGFTYYNDCVRDLANDASSRGGQVTSVEQYLAQFPPHASRVVHVEDGGWVFADSDFGSPTFINWNYPLITASGQPDPVNGWHEKPRDMAIFTAMLNRILTAQQIHSHTPNFLKILHPDASTTALDRAWHYYLGSLDSGNVYFGPALDLEVKATLGCNEAARLVDPLLTNLANDQTPPTIWLPQRFPYNPGGLNYGVEFGYRQVIDDGDFHIWTFIADPSGPANAVLKYRVDLDGRNPLDSIQNETYAGGPEVGSWISLPMARREFPKGLPTGYNDPNINFFELPVHIADHYSVEVTGLRDVLIDYYVEATDTRGNVARSPIQHVYIGTGEGSTTSSAVTLDPRPPVRGQNITVTYDATDRPLQGASTVRIHRGKNNWSTVVSNDPAMTSLGSNRWTITFPVDADATSIEMVFNNGAGLWDNNSGQDWRFTTTEASNAAPTANFIASPTSGTAPLLVQFTDQSTGGPTDWAWDFNNDGTVDSTDRHPEHTYAQAGTYTVALTASNSFGDDTLTRTSYITVAAAPTEPLIELNRTRIEAVATLGQNAPSTVFTVRNAGAATLNYDLSTSGDGVSRAAIVARLLGTGTSSAGLDANSDGVVDAADLISASAGVPWLELQPTSGSSSGLANSIAVSFLSAGLGVGTYAAAITVAGNASNSPQTIDVELTVADAVPTATTVVPNPPVAGASARVWYRQSGGPLGGASQIVLHWGVNGGSAPGGTWLNVTNSPMTLSTTAGMWYADITIPGAATSLNFVVNDGNNNWDNNGGQDWNFLIPGG
ncbi:MAG: PKD domain-containing protein [Candidatus Sumerlaeia bacterium]|nr:PKD domain-containing protein [Candidatus Sumerlaeia bacterium]